MLGVYPAKIQGKRDYEGWETGQIPCNKGDSHIGAKQIFKLFYHKHQRLPTIKHHCARTDTAASFRACSNKVDADPAVFEKFKIWFLAIFIPKFEKFLDLEDIHVNLDKWLDSGRYPIQYRDKLRKSFKPENWTDADNDKMSYEAFPKIELQFTEVVSDLRDTELNTVKERQICGPSDEKKCLANAFINELEGVAHRHLKAYCGRKDWPSMCKTIEDVLLRIPNLKFCSADGSGFDMSQLIEHNELMNKLIMTCARHKNVVFDDPLSVAGVEKALEASLKLFVNVNHGDLKYQARGRASGDGWTTFGNTMLMISYYQFTFEMASIKEEDYFLMVKGDDVLLAVSAEHKDQFMKAHKQLFTGSKLKHSHGLAQICTEMKWGDIEEMDFLSNHFFWTQSNRLRMTRIPARIIQTISWSTKLQGVTGDKFVQLQQELCYSKGMCLKAWARGLPMWEVLADKMIELGRPGSRTEYNYYADEQRVWQDRDDYAAYLLYLEQRFGITKIDVKEFENKVRNITSLVGAIEIDSLDRFYA